MSLLAYTEKGSGTPLILLHGFCESKELWNDFQEELSKDFWVICPDLPGFGESELDLDKSSMEYLAARVKELLDEKGIRQCVMIGHSLGGYVALAFAELYEEMLTGLGMFHSTVYADPPERKDARNRSYAFIKKHGVESFVTTFVPPLFFIRNRKRLEKEITYVTKLAAKSSPKGVLATILAMRDRDDRSLILKQLNFPVLYIIGKEDQSVTYDKSMEQVKLLKHPIVHVLEETGHMGMVERKEETMKMVKDYVLRIQKQNTEH